MKIVAHITRKDIIALNYYMLWRTPFNQVLLFIVIASVFFSNISSVQTFTIGYFAARFLIAVLVGICTILFCLVISLVFLQFNIGNKSGVLGKHIFELTERGLHEVTEANDSLHLWGSIKKIAMSKSFILLQINGYLFHIIPLNSFTNHQEADKFYQHAKSLKALT